MVASKSACFDPELQKKARLFRTLGHPARLQILQYLAQTRKCLTGDISGYFPLSRGTVNQHVRELKKAGLIAAHVEGAKVVWCLHLEKIREAEDVIRNFLETIHLPDDFCCSL